MFASHGSLGDLVPFLEIGAVLSRGGHCVRVATHAAHRKAVERYGLDFRPMRPDRPADPAWHRVAMHPRKGPRFIYNEVLTPAIADSDHDLLTACRDADILVSVTLALAAPMVAARLGLPWLSAAFQPSMLYSVYDPPKLPLLPFVRGKPEYNEWLLNGAKKVIEPWALPLRSYRRAEGLGEYPDHPIFRGQHSPDGVLALYSPLFGALPPDAPRGTVQTGQVLQTGGGAQPADVDAFLEAGEPPIVFTLGSASAHAARHFFDNSAAIARLLRRRALFLVGTAHNLRPSTDRALWAVSAPYQTVFPRAALVVHQGGIGTIALALAAKVPMVLVPFAHDQPDNSARAARTGAARVISCWRYGVWSAPTIAFALQSAAMRRAAADAGTLIRSENGAETAARHILKTEAMGRAARTPVSAGSLADAL